MDSKELFDVISDEIERRKASLEGKIDALKHQNKEIEESLNLQIQELSSEPKDMHLIPSFEETLHSCYLDTLMKYKAKRSIESRSLVSAFSSLRTKLSQIDEIKKSIQEILENGQKLIEEEHKQFINNQAKQKLQTEESEYLKRYQQMIEECDEKTVDRLEARNKRIEEKLRKLSIQHMQIKKERTETEERIEKISTSCQMLSEKIKISLETRSKYEGRKPNHNLSICHYKEQEITIFPTKRKTAVELGSLIVLAPIKSLTRRPRLYGQ